MTDNPVEVLRAAKAAFMTALAQHGIPTDFQGVLLSGDERGTIAPGGLDKALSAYRTALSTAPAQPSSGEVALSVGFARALPGGIVDNSTFEAIETALDLADAPSFDGKWLTLPERIERLAALAPPASQSEAGECGTFQARVQPWMMACFGAEISRDHIERNHRFLEEALELVQANGCTASEAHQLVDYTFGRPIGEPVQEVGGVMVTLAALCLASDLDMHNAGETELARIWTKVAQIRAKQAAKPKHSPLPEATLSTEGPKA